MSVQTIKITKKNSEIHLNVPCDAEIFQGLRSTQHNSWHVFRIEFFNATIGFMANIEQLAGKSIPFLVITSNPHEPSNIKCFKASNHDNFQDPLTAPWFYFQGAQLKFAYFDKMDLMRIDISVTFPNINKVPFHYDRDRKDLIKKHQLKVNALIDTYRASHRKPREATAK